jgi:hypothetical protein
MLLDMKDVRPMALDIPNVIGNSKFPMTFKWRKTLRTSWKSHESMNSKRTSTRAWLRIRLGDNLLNPWY